jgi:hypothetical protein
MIVEGFRQRQVGAACIWARTRPSRSSTNLPSDSGTNSRRRLQTSAAVPPILDHAWSRILVGGIAWRRSSRVSLWVSRSFTAYLKRKHSSSRSHEAGGDLMNAATRRSFSSPAVWPNADLVLPERSSLDPRSVLSYVRCELALQPHRALVTLEGSTIIRKCPCSK